MIDARKSVFDPEFTGSKNTTHAARLSLVKKVAAALGVAALGVATAAAGLACTAPPAHAATDPVLVKWLGGNQKNDVTDDSNSEIRADFIVKVAAGDDLASSASYSGTPKATASDAEAAINVSRGLHLDPSALMAGGDPEGFYVQQKVTIGDWDYYAITLMADAAYGSANQPASCTDNPWQGFNAFKITTAGGGSLVFTAPIDMYDANCGPVLPTTWDGAYGSSATGNDEDNFGVNIGQDPSSGNTDGTSPKAGRFIMDIRDKSGATTCDTEYYEWVDMDGNSAGSGSETVTPHTSGTGTIGSGSVELPAGANLTPTGPGYYKLMAWPCTKGTAAEAWQVGSVFNDVLPNSSAIVPIITAPADSSTITKKNGSPIKISGTLPARTDQRAYAAGDALTVTDDKGAKVCDATVVAAAAGKATTWSCTATLKDGDYTITATYRQASESLLGLTNLTSSPSAPVSFEVDRTAVAPMTITPKSGSKLTTSPDEISGTATDALNGPGTVTVMDGDTVLCQDLPVAADGSWSCVLTDPLTVGTHAISIRYTDEVGNVSDPVTVTYEVLAPGAGPTITVQPVAPTTTTTPEPLAFTGGSITGPLALGGGLAALGAIVYVLARRARAHRRALTA